MHVLAQQAFGLQVYRTVKMKLSGRGIFRALWSASRRQFASASSIVHMPRLDKYNRCIHIDFAPNDSLKLQLAWLRDNCQCSRCLNTSINQRKLHISNFDPRVDVQSIEVFKEGTGVLKEEESDQATKLKVNWHDSHTSVYDFRWLKRFSYNSSARQRRENEIQVAPQRYWNVDKLKEIGGVPRFSFNKLMNNDSELRKCLHSLVDVGLIVLHGLPLERGQIVRVCNRIAFVRQSHYGYTFSVEYKPDPSNEAYTYEALSLHTDLPYLSEPPGIQLLHCIKAAAGNEGLSTFADGFHCAEILRKEREEYFRILTETKVQFKDHSSDAVGRFWLLASHPTIALHPKNGKLASITMNTGQRDVMFDCPFEKLQLFYDALKYYDSLLHSPVNLLAFKLQQGEMVAFDNRRILHGRTEYRGERFIEGCYLGWDETKSRLRVLMKDYSRGKEKS